MAACSLHGVLIDKLGAVGYDFVPFCIIRTFIMSCCHYCRSYNVSKLVAVCTIRNFNCIFQFVDG